MIINAVLRMSRWLNIPVIAEGVEIADQADFLLSIGCPTIQGYVYERPVPANEFEDKFLRKRSLMPVPQDSIIAKIDSNSFWNPLSADSQVFNSFIGPAIVFEFQNGNYEIVRMNRGYIELMHMKNIKLLPTQRIISFVTDEDRPRLDDAVLDAIRTKRDTKITITCKTGSGDTIKATLTLRAIGQTAVRALMFASVEM